MPDAKTKTAEKPAKKLTPMALDDCLEAFAPPGEDYLGLVASVQHWRDEAKAAGDETTAQALNHIADMAGRAEHDLKLLA